MADNYVAPSGNGYVVVVNGKQIGNYPTQAEAEQAYNANGGPKNFGNSSNSTTPPPADDKLYDTPNGPKTMSEMISGLQNAGWPGNYNDPAAVYTAYYNTASGSSAAQTPTGNPAVDQSWQNLVDAAASGNQQQFDEAKREYDQSLQQSQYEFNQKQYQDLATNLLNTASQLTGPSDYFQFQKFASGGKDLMNTLFGSQPAAKFTAPQGQPTPMTIDQLMADLGFRLTPTPGSPSAGGSSTTYNTVNGPKTTDQMLSELKAAGWPPAQGDSRPSDQDIANAYASTTKGAVTPSTTAAAASSAPATAAPQATATPPPTAQPQTSPTVQTMTTAAQPSVPKPTTNAPFNVAAVMPATQLNQQNMVKLPVYDTGGTVPGMPGQHQVAVLEAGEKVTPPKNAFNTTAATSPFNTAGSSLPSNGASSNIPTLPNGGNLPLAPGQSPPATQIPLPSNPPGTSGASTPTNGVIPLPPNSGPSQGNTPPTEIPLPPGHPGPPPTPQEQLVQQLAGTPPYQINPIVWDSLDPNVQKLVLSAVSDAGWDSEVWLNELNAQRPTGSLPSSILMQYYGPQGVY